MLSTAIGLLVSGALCLWVSRRRRRGMIIESDVRVEPQLMCINCWSYCDPERDFVTMNKEWYCTQCWKAKWKRENK